MNKEEVILSLVLREVSLEECKGEASSKEAWENNPSKALESESHNAFEKVRVEQNGWS